MNHLRKPCPKCGEPLLLVRSVFPGEDDGKCIYACRVVLRGPNEGKAPRPQHHEIYGRDIQ